MKKLFLHLAVFAFLITGLELNAQCQIQKDQSQESTSNSLGTYGTDATNVWQSFTPSVSGKLENIQVYKPYFYIFSSKYCWSSSFTLQIFEGEGTSGTQLYSGNFHHSNCGWQNIDILTNSAPSLTAGNVYTFYLSAYDAVLRGRNANVYSGGKMNGDNNWDLAFRTYMLPNDNYPPVVKAKNIDLPLDVNGQASITANDIDNGSSDDYGIASMSLNRKNFSCSDLNNQTPNYALDFDGVDDRVVSFTSKDLPQVNSGRTVEMWIKTTMGGAAALFSHGNFAYLQRSALYLVSGRIYFVGEFNDIWGGNTIVNDGRWHHVAYTLVGRDIKFYVDGKLDLSATLANDPQTAGASWAMSNTSGIHYTREPYRGVMDEVRVWSMARSPGEIMETWNKPLGGNEDNLVSYYTFDDGQGPLVRDLTTNHNDGQLTNMDPATDWVTGAPPFNHVNRVLLTVTDNCGNSDDSYALVNVIDDAPPTVVAQNLTLELDENGEAFITVEDIDNGSSDNCEIVSLEIDNDRFDCSNISTGSEGTLTSNLTVDNAFELYLSTDNKTAGTLLTQGNNFGPMYSNTTTLPEGQDYWIHVKAIDIGLIEMFIGDFTLTGSFQFENGTQQLGTNTQNWRVSDTSFGWYETTPINAGSQGVHPWYSSGYQHGAYHIWHPTWNTDPGQTVYFSAKIVTTNPGNFVTLTATDASGNTGTAKAMITIEDNTAPTVSTQNFTVFLDENGEASITEYDVDNGSSDNCGIESLSIDKTNFSCDDVDGRQSNFYAIELDGQNDYVDFGSMGNALDYSSQATFQVWVKPESIASGIKSIIEANDRYTGQYLAIETGSGSLAGHIYFYATGSFVRTNSSILQVGEWVNLTCVYDGTQSSTSERLKIYINGQRSSVSPWNTPPTSVGDLPSLFIGSQWGTAQFNNATYDEVRVWDRALSSTEVSTNWNKTITGSESGLIAYYSFEDGTGSSYVTELSGTQGLAELKNMDAQTCWVSASEDLLGNKGVEVKLTASDASGNTTVESAYVSVKDNLAPIVITQNMTIALDENGFASITVEDIDNGSSDNCTIESFSLSQTEFDCTNLGLNEVILSATDNSGNVGTATAMVEVTDNIAPTAVCQNITVELDANGVATVNPEDVDNGSSDNCGVSSLTVEPSTFDCSYISPNPDNITISNPVVRGYAGRTVTFSNTTLNGQGNKIVVAPGSQVSLSLSWNSKYTSNYCPGCIQQFYVGIQGVFRECLYSGNTSRNRSGSRSVSFTAPTQPGVYYVQSNSSLQYSCKPVGFSTSGNNALAAIVVAPEVQLTVSDEFGNQSVCKSYVFVEDNIAPTVFSKDITVELNASGVASILPEDLDNGSFDNCGIEKFSISRNNFSCADAGQIIDVKLVAYDKSGNVSHSIAQVTVEDNTAPFVATNDVTVELDANGIGSITTEQIDNNSSDACGIASITLDRTTFTCVDLGNNTVTLEVTDVNGNVASATANVEVVDNIAPTVTTNDITVELDETGSVSITEADIDGGSFDNCSISSISISQNTFDCSVQGTTVAVELTVVDGSGNVSTAFANVTVEDNITPVANCKPVIIYLDENGYASIFTNDVDGGSFDNCGISSMVLSQSEFDCSNIGPNEVTLTVTDAAGNSSVCQTVVEVYDNTPPTALCQNVIVELDANGQGSISVDDVDNGSYDNCGIQSIILSQTDFDCSNVGANTVELTVTDNNGLVSVCTANVQVFDFFAPTVMTQDVTVYLDDNGYASVQAEDIDNGSYDNCEISSLTLNNNDFYCEDTGDNQVELTVFDVNGNFSTAFATVTVVDSTLPTISVSVSPNTLWPPNHKMQTITATVDYDDNCASGTSVYLKSVTSNEPDNSKGDGDKPNDIQGVSLGTADFSFELRKERMGGGSGRIYTIVYAVVDGSGNETEATAYVTVPHSKKRDAIYEEVSELSGASVQVYPNPATDIVNIDFNAETAGNLELRLMDISGKELMTINKNNVDSFNDVLNVDDLPSGTYLIEFRFNLESKIMKVVKY